MAVTMTEWGPASDDAAPDALVRVTWTPIDPDGSLLGGSLVEPYSELGPHRTAPEAGATTSRFRTAGMFWTPFEADTYETPIYDVDEALTLVEDASVSVIRFIAEALTFVEDGNGASLSQFVEEELEFVEQAIHTFTEDVAEALIIDELLLRNFEYSASDALTFVEEVDAEQIIRVFEALDALAEVVSRTREVPKSVSETLTLAEVLQRLITGIASESLSFVEALARLKFGAATEVMSLAEDADGDAIKAIFEELEFEEDADRSGSIYVRAVVEEIEFDDVAAWSMVGGDSPCLETYDPGIGIRTGLRLTYPYVAPSVTLDLRMPKFGNAQQVTKNVKVRRTLTGQLRIARSSTWPVVEELKMSFEALTRAQRDALLSFVQQASGQEIGLLDHEDRQWRGIILSPNVSVSQEGRSDCDYAASFTFRGRIA